MTMRMIVAIVAIITALTVVAVLGIGIAGLLVMHQPIVTVTCALLVFFLGTFVVKDFNFFFGKN